MHKSGELESHAPFGGILKAKRNFEKSLNEQCLRHHGGGWWVVHGREAVFGMPEFSIFPWAEIRPFACKACF